jgi:hypothetical protein
MPNPFRSSGACPDRLVLQRSCDGDLSPAEAARVAGHVEACAACRTACDRLDADRALVTIALGEEDEANEAQARDTLDRVRRRLAEATEVGDRRAPATEAWPMAVRAWLRALTAGPAVRRAALATAALAVVAVVTGVVWNRVTVSASAERVLTESRVREHAWRFEPGRTRVEVLDYTWREPGKDPRRAVRTFWFSTVPGEESYTAREFDASGALAAAWWMTSDGWSATFNARAATRLTLEPPMAELTQRLPMLPAEHRAALEYWIQNQRRQVRPQELAAPIAAAVGQSSGLEALQGERRGRPQLVREGASYRLTYRAVPTFEAPVGTMMVYEDTLAVADLAFERRVIRVVGPGGDTMGETDRRLISRKEADPGEFARLMAQVDAPPPNWNARRRTVDEVLAQAVAIWKALRPH